MMLFRKEPVTPVYRRWMCEQVGCNGELLSTGDGITRLSTPWKHRCGKCGHEDWADTTYPRVAYLPIDAIGPDDLRLLRAGRTLAGQRRQSLNTGDRMERGAVGLLSEFTVAPHAGLDQGLRIG